MNSRKILAVFCTFVLVLFAGTTLKAQDISGTISGTVLDGTGAAVAGATVTVTNTDKNTSQTTQTNDRGEFTVPNLLVGHYSVTVEAKSFKKVEQKEIMLNVHDQLGLSFKLEVGSATETLTVNAGRIASGNADSCAAGTGRSEGNSRTAIEYAKFRAVGDADAGRFFVITAGHILHRQLAAFGNDGDDSIFV